MLLRSATIDDFQKIADLNTASWRFAYRAALSEEYLAGDVESDQTQLWESRLTSPTKNQHILLAEEAGYLVGFACVYVGENPQWGSYLNNIHVAHASQGAGVGRQLLNAVAGLCSKSCHGGLYLWVLQSNVKAQGFYARHGAQNAGADIWEAPGGTTAPVFRFVWESIDLLQKTMANPSIEYAPRQT